MAESCWLLSEPATAPWAIHEPYLMSSEPGKVWLAAEHYLNCVCVMQ